MVYDYCLGWDYGASEINIFNFIFNFYKCSNWTCVFIKIEIN